MSELRCDAATTSVRIALLTDYMDRSVLGPHGFLCSSADDCRRSVLLGRDGKERIDRSFSEGQLSHVGEHYDLLLDGLPLRILVVAMETGRDDVGVTMPERRLQLARSAALPFGSRNPHMRGTTSLLRSCLGRAPSDDRVGEMIELPDELDPVHIFDCYAMADIRLCSATLAGTSTSKGTRVMSRNCIRHLAATIEILEPTLIVVQGIPVAEDLATLISRSERITSELSMVAISGVPAALACFTHPSAKSLHQHWGRLTSADYLWNTVLPTVKLARERLGLS